MVGPAVAGLLIAAGGLVIAFLLNAASFAVIAVVLWGLPRSVASQASRRRPRAAAPTDDARRGAGRATHGPPGSPLRRPRRGAGHRHGACSCRSSGSAVDRRRRGRWPAAASRCSPWSSPRPSLGGGEEATGFLNAGIGLGGFIGALVAGALVLRPSLVPVLVGGSFVYAVGLAALGFAPALGVAIVAIAVAAAGSL